MRTRYAATLPAARASRGLHRLPKIFLLTKPHFVTSSKIVRNEDIRNQTIWSNKYIKFKRKTLLFKNWIKDGVILVKNLKLNNGILDIGYLSTVIKDKRRFYSDINILQTALRSAKINISIEPVKDANIPTHSHHTNEE